MLASLRLLSLLSLMANLVQSLLALEELDKDVLCRHIFLFLQSMSYLCSYRKLQKPIISQVFRFVQIAPPIHSLMFADDLIVCGKANIQEAQIISNILNQFCHDSGQTPNWSKSGILFSNNVPLSNKQNVKRIFPAPNIDSSFVHLGHPLILPSKDRSAAYAFIYDKFKSKLSTYKANHLSHAARLTLIKSVFASIPVYYMSNILFSKKIPK